ncbi:uncharacterized protein LOC143284134 [Babylonia areolata]|uniref:uncharacterized protein LOC143284134 n=1 Tax=Babylonia areolata TaxID=304850 RepID=UPI003FD54B07
MTSPCVLQLDDVIRRHAWDILKKRSNIVRRWLLEEKDYFCDVDWKAFVFEHKVCKFDIRPDGHTYSGDWGSIKTGVKWVPLHTCDFENRSETKQCHTFRGKRETTAWMAVDLTQTFTVSNTVDLDLTFPPNFLHHRVGRDPTFKVNKVKGGIFREVLEWQVNSQVEVMPSWKAHAQLLARQECHVIDVEIRTTFSVPSGVVPVYFKRRSDNSYAFEVKIDNVEEAFNAAPPDQLQAEGSLAVQRREREEPIVHTLMEKVIDTQGQPQPAISKLQLVTRGTCMVVSWSDQKVDIATIPLSLHQHAPPADGGDVPGQ